MGHWKLKGKCWIPWTGASVTDIKEMERKFAEMSPEEIHAGVKSHAEHFRTLGNLICRLHLRSAIVKPCLREIFDRPFYFPAESDGERDMRDMRGVSKPPWAEQECCLKTSTKKKLRGSI